jgi:ATP-dependent DNA helicase RecQ
MLYARKDKGLQSFFIQSSSAPQNIKDSRWKTLEALVNYSEGGECRHAEILTYYKDSQRIEKCGHCDTCDPGSVRKIQPVLTPINNFVKMSSPKKNKSRNQSLDVILDLEQEQRLSLLKQWRKRKAQELDLPSFVIFSDKTLRHLAILNPQTLNDLQSVYGVGESKLEKFGADILVELSI